MWMLLAMLGYLAILGCGLMLLALTVPEEVIERDATRQRQERGVIYFQMDTAKQMSERL